MNDTTQKKIISSPDLKSYFFDRLEEINQKAFLNLPQEALFYSSHLLEKYSQSSEFFEIDEGKVKEKILCLKLLDTKDKNSEEYARVLKDVGDTSLFMCGFFARSLERKIVDSQYYEKMGTTAYQHLNQMVPSYLDTPSFYKSLAGIFRYIAQLFALLAKESHIYSQPQAIYLQSTLLKAS